MSYSLFHILHLVFLFALVAFTAAAIAAPKPENRKLFLAGSGFSSLVVFLSGFMLLVKIQIGFPGWIVVKLLCWLALSALAGIAFRKTELAKQFSIGLICILAIAVTMVSLQPF